MIIAVNTRLLLKNKLEGIGWFTYETMKIITKAHPEHTFFFIFDRPYDKSFVFSDNVTPIVVSPPTRHPFLWYLWFELKLPFVLKKIKADLFFSPDGFLSLRTKVKSIAVIHDINFAHRPKDLPYIAGKYYNYFIPRYARKAKKIITVSEFSKRDISKTYNISEEKIAVVYNGSNSIYLPIKEEDKEKIKKEYSGGNEYFVFIGALHPRKNISSLFIAFDKFKLESGLKHKLIIVGKKLFMNNKMTKALSEMKYSNDVIFVGRLIPEKLRGVLGSALALTFVPLFEGFGIPIVEAMKCDVPVLASQVTSLPEVAGDAALYVNPFSVDSIKEGMLKLASDDNLRNKLIIEGKKQCLKFSWEKTAEKVWKNIETCLHQ